MLTNGSAVCDNLRLAVKKNIKDFNKCIFYALFRKEYKLDIDIEYQALDKNAVRVLKSNDIKINCWTCDDKDYAEKLVKMGVDFITSNILE